MGNNADIGLRIDPLENGFLVSAHKTHDGYRTAYTGRTYIATREEVIAHLPTLYAEAEALRPEDAKDDF